MKGRSCSSSVHQDVTGHYLAEVDMPSLTIFADRDCLWRFSCRHLAMKNVLTACSAMLPRRLQ